MEQKSNNNFLNFEHFIRQFEPNLWIFPFFGGLILFLTLILCYLVTSFVQGYPVFWLVSDVGASSPVSGYFSQSMDLITILFAFTMYLRCKQIDYYIKEIIPESKNHKVNNPEMIRILNEKNYQSFKYAILSSIGFMIMGNFDSFEHINEHGVGAFFMFATIPFLFSQKFIADKLYECDQIERRSVLLTIITYTVAIGWPLAASIFVCSLWLNGSLFDWFKMEQRLYWPNDSPSYYLYCFGIIIEWLVIMSYSPILFILSNRFSTFKHWNRIVY
ncbi:uncharacterized protein LOC113791291 [Dermatophagoides pteronyssinus]|uniref:uncharacterized protein LOC113791291 n=1 Tax=Dermatophagoides pteronyssinus TaxID=6956 RepID=UPI003F67BAD6